MIRRPRWRRSSTTPHGDVADANFEITHPHHPLRGQRFKLVTYRHNWGEDRVYFHDAAGKLRSIPACWTTVVAEDPFVAMAAGRCFFRFEDLLKLVDLVEKLR
jgi:hypothetical protein